jgi:hypothetical protein
MTGAERKRRWRVRNPERRRAAERARSRRHSREYGGSYWNYEHGFNPWRRDHGRMASRDRQYMKALRARIKASDEWFASIGVGPEYLTNFDAMWAGILKASPVKIAELKHTLTQRRPT